MKNLSITERRNESVVILDLKGNIRLGEGNVELHKAIRLLVEKGEKKIVLNLADVAYIDSSGLGEIVAGYTNLRNNNGELKIINLTKRVHELMVITKLLTVFDVYENEADAVAGFGKSLERNETEKANFESEKAESASANS